MKKNFPLPANELERLEELRRFSLLDTPPEKAFDKITQLAAQIFATPIAAVTLIDEDRQWFKSCVGLETREISRDFAFCAHAILGDDVMVVPDAWEDARFAEHPWVTSPPNIRFYAAAPLRTKNGLNLGTLTISDTKPREMTPESKATLLALAALVVSEIELRYETGEHQRTKEGLHLLQKAIEQSDEAVLITTALIDLPGPEIVFVNPAFTTLTGFLAEEAIGKTPRIMQGPQTDPLTRSRVRELLTNGEAFSFDSLNYRKDGSTFPSSSYIAPIRDSTGLVTHFISFLRDTTERDRVALLMHHAKEEAVRANLAKDEFLSRMSHELRTPLHAILGYSQLLEMDALSVEDNESVSHIIRAGNHLLELINEVLDIAMVESGKLTLAVEPVNVREAIEEASILIKPQAAERSVTLETPYGELDCFVQSNPQRFRQVLLNLLSNAVKFNSAAGTVAVLGERSGEFLRIRITDSGRGISQENIKRLFVPFERIEVSGVVTEGTGLGLSLSKHLVEAMGGRIGLDSVLDQGTTFWIELPIAENPDESAPQVLGESSSQILEPMSQSNSRTVLYIEDNLSNLRLIKRILSRRPNIRLFSTMQGQEGLALAREHLPDLVLLDLHLPDMDGDEVLQFLRSDPRTTRLPVIIISADATKAQIDRLRSLGATHYLTKPIDVHQFLALVDSIDRFVS